MELIEENPLSSSKSPLSFIDCEIEEMSMSPRVRAEGSEIQINRYGRLIAEILPTPRISRQQSIEIVRPIPTYLPDFSQESSNFQHVRAIKMNS